MTDQIATFDGSIPETYDALLGPLFFAPYADDLARRVAAAAPARVLEIACGTGILTRRLRAALPEAVMVASDLSEAMIAHARQGLGEDANVTFGQADAGDLPYPDATFDAVVCQFGIMFFPDKPRAMAEALRVLAPGGVLAFNSWGSLEENALAGLADATVSRFFATDPPRFYKTPFGYHDDDAIARLLADAGFGDIEGQRVALEATGEAAPVAHGLIHGNPTIGEIEARGSAPPETVVAALAEAIASAHGDPLRAPMQALVFTARKPAA